MLEYLRNAADKPLAKVLMFVLIFSFVGWGAAEWIFGGSMRDTTLIKVGDSEISVQQFNNERSHQLSMMTKEEQKSAYMDPAKAAQLNNSVMTTLTMNQLALNRAIDLGFVVSDKRIAKEIRMYPQFQHNGEFSSYLFDIVLQNNGMREQDFANILRADILRQMAVGASNVPLHVPQFAVDALYNARYAKRDIKYATVKFGDYKIKEPSEEELKSYYAQNPKIVPETRSVSYVFVAADMSKPDAYDEGFKKAQQIEDMIISGDSMKTASDKYHAKFVSVPEFNRNVKLADKVLNADLIAKVFSMEVGMESELLELKEGFAILRVENITPEHNAEFKDVKKDLVNAWKKSEQRKQAYVNANEMLVQLNKSGEMKNAKSVSVSRTDGAPLTVLSSAFSGKIGENILVESGDAFYVLHIDKSVTPKSDEAKKKEIRKELEKMTARFMMDDYSQYLKRHYPVKVKEKTYQRFIAK